MKLRPRNTETPAKQPSLPTPDITPKTITETTPTPDARHEVFATDGNTTDATSASSTDGEDYLKCLEQDRAELEKNMQSVARRR
jgi:hypothetical protein